jgi:hypothetical protein
MVDEFGLTVMDATLPIPEQQRRMRQLVLPHLQGVRRLRTPKQEPDWLRLGQEMGEFHAWAEKYPAEVDDIWGY